MAGLQTVLYQTNFSSQSSITVTHNLDIPSIGLVVRVVINNISRPDLVDQVYPTPTDPTNSMGVILTSSQTGYVQVLNADIIKFASGADFVNTFGFQEAEALGGVVLRVIFKNHINPSTERIIWKPNCTLCHPLETTPTRAWSQLIH